MLDRISARLQRSDGPPLLAALASLLGLPALALGFQLDDHVMRSGALSAAKLPLWHVPAALLDEQRQRGFWAWWSSPRLEIAFFRPLSWLSHRLDYALWPESSAAMSLQNVLLYALLVWVAAGLYRRVFHDLELAALGGLMYALDEAHACVVGWIACRNTLLAALFSLGALALHERARSARSRWLQVASAAVVGLALLSGEAGVASLGMLAAYALVLDPGPPRERALSVAPALAVGVCWAAYYFGAGYGMRGTSWYRELSDPRTVIAQGLWDLPLWIYALFGPAVLNTALAVPPLVARVLVLPFALGFMWFLVPAARSAKSLRFFALACLFTLAPMLLTVPQDRHTLSASFAASGWLAGFIASARVSPRASVRVAANLLIALNVWLAALTFPLQLRSTRPLEIALRSLAHAVPAGAKQVVFLNSPIEIMENEVPFMLGMDRRAAGAPETFHTLYAGGSALELLRTDARTLEVTSLDGWGSAPIGRIFCALRDMPRLNEVRRVSGLTVRVLELNQRGLPRVVRFEFDSALEDAARAWLVWRGQAPERWAPPAIGQRVTLAATPLLTALPMWSS